MKTDKLKNLIDYCLENDENITRMEYTKPVRSVSEAISVSGVEKSDFIKTVILRHKSERNFVIAIILGGSKVDKKALQEGVRPKRWRLATHEEVLEVTGFPVGGVPPICLGNKAELYVDPRVMKKEWVVGGGGTSDSLVKLRPNLIVRQGAKIKIISFG